MTALVLKPDTYYRVLSRKLDMGHLDLYREDIVLCTEIVHRSHGYRGRGRYATLLHLRDGQNVVLRHRVSSYGRGSGNWEEVNPMMVLALADQLPTL